MNQRLHSRLVIQLEASLTDLTNEVRTEHGQLVDVSESGVCVLLPLSLPKGNLVRVDFSEGSLFGQIMHVTPEGSEFRTGVEVFRVLLGSSDLARLIELTLQLQPQARIAS